MQKIGFIILSIFLFSSCIAENSAIKVAFKDKKHSASMSVSSVQIINNQLVIHGVNLDEATNVSISGNSLSENFTIESKNATQVTANARHGFSFDISKVFNLLISNAEASATFAIDFSICNASLGTAGFDCTAPSNNDVLTYDVSSNKWIPKALTGLSYKGVWDANTTEPTSTVVGQYYIVDTANLPTYKVGDWIVWNGSAYDVVAQSVAGGVSTAFGRSGAVVATEGDYNLDKLLDVDLTVAPTAGQVLKFNGTKWIADTDTAGAAGGAGSVTTTELADGSVTNVKIADIAATKITGTITSAQITDATIVNADISATAAIAYSKLSIPALSIPYSQLNIADGDIPAAKISGLAAGLPSGGTTLQYFAGDKTLQTLNTTAVPESGTNYYFTDVRTRAATLTGLSSASGTIAGTDTVLAAFGKLLGTQGDYVSKSANTTVLGKITIDNTLGELHIPTLPTVGADLTQAASAGYVQNVFATGGQWIKTLADIGYIAGNVGIGTATPGMLLDVNGSARATNLLAGNGAFNTPSITFSNFPSTGLSSDGNLRFSVSGGLKMILSPSALDFNAGGAGPKIQQTGGNAALPSYAFNGDSDTGMFNPNSSGGSNELAFSTAGVERVRIDPAGNVGIGKTAPGSALDVAGQITADAFLLRGDMYTFGWDATVYTSTSASLGTPDGAAVHVTNANTLDGSVSLFTGASLNTLGTTQTFYMGSVANTTGYAPTIVFGQRTGNTAYNERMRISASGNVGIGTSNPQATLTVAGTIASTPPAPFTGAAVDLSKSNTQVLTSVGQAAITLSNMVHGGSYTLIIQDTTSRTYTFTGCTTSKFQPANMPTIAATHTMYNIMTVYNGTNYDCYITWSSGYN